ncbi:MAG TPA: LssY C-terminal domain-containing protein [Methylocystis sp.]|nr:LssY C-terminal domain-containing protein [Methylocystis sp.]
MIAKRIDRRLAAAAIGAVAAYVVLAYGLAPFFWRHFEHEPRLAEMEATTRTALGIPGDAINVGLEGTEDDVLCAMNAAGWKPADPVTLSSSLRIVGSVLFDKPYRDAPVSPLYYDGREQDLAFEKPAGKSATKRHHVRFWKVLEAGDDGLPVWLGAATFDDKVGVSHYTGQITHHVAPDIDAERELLSNDLAAANKVEATYSVSGVGPTLLARNGGGDPYFTDGDVTVSKLVSGCATQESAPAVSSPPPQIAAKNAIFSWIAAIWRAWR